MTQAESVLAAMTPPCLCAMCGRRYDIEYDGMVGLCSTDCYTQYYSFTSRHRAAIFREWSILTDIAALPATKVRVA